MNTANRKYHQNSVLLSLKKTIGEIFHLDLRSLVLLRVGIGLLLLVDLSDRLSDLQAQYTDFGILPVEDAIKLLDSLGGWKISIHLWSGSSEYQLLLFLIQAIFAIFLFFGYKTRLSTIVSWFMLMSVQNRHPLLQNSGDMLLRIMLFWSIFLPLGAQYSFDAAFGFQKLATSKITSLASSAFVLQVFLLYFFASLLKSGVEWRVEDSAVYYTLRNDIYVSYFGKLMLNFPDQLKFLTRAVVGWEMFGALLLFSPLMTGLMRIAVVFGFMLMHIGFAAALTIGLFPYICMVAVLALLPTIFWKWLIDTLGLSRRSKLRIYYDGECSFCKKISHLFKVFLILSNSEVLPATQNLEIEREMFKHNSWVIVDNTGKKYFRSDGVVVLFKHSPLFWWLSPLVRFINQIGLGEIIYKIGSKFHDNKCPIEAKVVPKNPVFTKSKYLINSFLIVCILFMFWSNLVGFWGRESDTPFKRFGMLIGLYQSWGMFSPQPPKIAGWYLVAGVTKSGKNLDLLTEKNLSWDKPELPTTSFRNDHWRKYLATLTDKDQHSQRLLYAQYLCRNWEINKNQPLKDLELVFMYQLTTLEGQTEPEKRSLIKYDCRNDSELLSGS